MTTLTVILLKSMKISRPERGSQPAEYWCRLKKVLVLSVWTSFSRRLKKWRGKSEVIIRGLRPCLGPDDLGPVISLLMSVRQDLLDSHGNNGDGNVGQGCLLLLSLPHNIPTPTTECLSNICKVKMKTFSELLKMNERWMKECTEETQQEKYSNSGSTQFRSGFGLTWARLSLTIDMSPRGSRACF